MTSLASPFWDAPRDRRQNSAGGSVDRAAPPLFHRTAVGWCLAGTCDFARTGIPRSDIVPRMTSLCAGIQLTEPARMFSLRSGLRNTESPMPARAPSANPFRNPRISDAARDGKLLTMRCGLCRRTAHFWATDLVAVVGGDHQAHVAPFPCSKCGHTDYIDLRWSVPSASELQTLTVRRPVRQVVKWIWRNERA